LKQVLLCTSLAILLLPASFAQKTSRSWTADNGNGTYSNPLFYDEFSDPDMIRVVNDFYLTGTTMHTMPGLPILHDLGGSVALLRASWEPHTHARHLGQAECRWRFTNDLSLRAQR
jgi:hypothetical protein